MIPKIPEIRPSTDPMNACPSQFAGVSQLVGGHISGASMGSMGAVMNLIITVLDGSPLSPGLQSLVAGAERFIWEPCGELLTQSGDNPWSCHSPILPADTP